MTTVPAGECGRRRVKLAALAGTGLGRMKPPLSTLSPEFSTTTLVLAMVEAAPSDSDSNCTV